MTVPTPCPAILFIVFNRPTTTARVFEAIRLARPSRFYVAADGPRKDRAGELAAVEEVRRIATHVDWPCELQTLVRESNLGCKRAVSTAIDWFFANEVEGVILEDDCLPHPDFFAYCAAMLDRYRHDERIGLISGTALMDLRKDGLAWGDEDYIYSRYFSIWGWASWRRVWKDYGANITAWQSRRKDVIHLTANRRLRQRHVALFDGVFQGKIDTWDYQVAFMMWSANRLAVSPRFNLIENLGFGPAATHTVRQGGEIERRSKMASERLHFPLAAPPMLCPNHAFQLLMERLATRPRFVGALQALIRRN